MVVSEGGLFDVESASHEGLGFVLAVRGLEERRQVAEVSGDVRVVISEGGLVDLESTPHVGLGLVQAVRGMEVLGQVVEADGDLGLVVSGFGNVESTPDKGLSLG